MTVKWKQTGDTHSARINGHDCKIVRYPEGSPLAGKYGCYRDGSFQGIATTLTTAKNRCSAAAGLPLRKFGLDNPR
jgi:hypothetical protein